MREVVFRKVVVQQGLSRSKMRSLWIAEIRCRRLRIWADASMSRSARRQKSEAQLRTLEDQFSTDVVAALKECAAGRWGMFGRNDAVIERQPGPIREIVQSDVAAHLIALGRRDRAATTAAWRWW